jgi:hypothetical protein
VGVGELSTKKAGLVERLLRVTLVEGVPMLRELPVAAAVGAAAMAALVVERSALALVESEPRAGDAEEVGRAVRLLGGVVRIVVGNGVELAQVHTLLLEGMGVVTGWLDMDLLLLKRKPGGFVVPDPALIKLIVLLFRTIGVVVKELDCVQVDPFILLSEIPGVVSGVSAWLEMLIIDVGVVNTFEGLTLPEV